LGFGVWGLGFGAPRGRMDRYSDRADRKLDQLKRANESFGYLCELRGCGALSISWRDGILRSQYRIQGSEIAGREQERVESENPMPFALRQNPETLVSHEGLGAT